MLKLRSRRQTGATTVTENLIDPETGLPTGEHFLGQLQRDIARGLRYGSHMAVVAIEVTAVGFEPTVTQHEPPSPAIAVAIALRDAVRQADLLGRVGQHHFVATLAECTEDHAEQFSERLRTKLSTRPYARDASGKGIYLRAWAAALAWTPEYDTAEGYLAAALAKMDRTRSQIESVQSWYEGDY